MQNFTPRDYQLKAHQELIKAFKKKQKPLLKMPTGAGKSKTVISFIKSLGNHYNVVLVVRNRKLVNQLAKDCELFGLDYGVCMAAHDEFDLTKPLQVCSIDTMSQRGIYPHENDEKPLLLFIDEVDQALSATFQYMINRYLNRGNPTHFGGMTATPYDKALSFLDVCIEPITAKELMRRGFLVDYKYIPVKTKIDYSGITLAKGEWSTKQVSLKMNTNAMIKSCFEDWLNCGDNRQTLAFCIDKAHAKNYTEYVNNYYGKRMAAFVYDKTPDKEREKIFDEFEKGIIRILVNVRIITRGTDLPVIGCIHDMSPTASINNHIQKLGRGSRPNPFYNDCIVLDPCGNVWTNNHFYFYREVNLKFIPKRTKKDIDAISIRVCKKCFKPETIEAFGKNNKCPYCGFLNSPLTKKKISKAQEKKIFLESASPEKIEQVAMINQFKKFLWICENTGKRYPNNIARIYAKQKMLKKYGVDKCLQIKKSIGLDDHDLKKFKDVNSYRPLGGLDL